MDIEVNPWNVRLFVRESGDMMMEHYKGKDMNAAKKRRKERARKLTAQRMAEIQAQKEGRKI